MAMNLNQIYYFVALAEAEHYTKAAETLAIAQPTLSHAIALLEEELGAKLFEKRGRNVVLTKSGRLFLEYASESLQTLEAGIKKNRAMNGENSGVIDLAFIYTLGLEFVPGLVRNFFEKYPQVFFTKSSGLRPTIEKLFQAAGTVPRIAYEIEEDSAMAGLAAKNFGIAVMPDIPVLQHLDIKKLKITRPVIERYIYMAQIKDRYQPPAVKKFAAYVQECQKFSEKDMG